MKQNSRVLVLRSFGVNFAMEFLSFVSNSVMLWRVNVSSSRRAERLELVGRYTSHGVASREDINIAKMGVLGWPKYRPLIALHSRGAKEFTFPALENAEIGI